MLVDRQRKQIIRQQGKLSAVKIIGVIERRIRDMRGVYKRHDVRKKSFEPIRINIEVHILPVNLDAPLKCMIRETIKNESHRTLIGVFKHRAPFEKIQRISVV